MKLTGLLLAAAILLTPLNVRAAADKILENMRGSLTYEVPGSQPKALAQSASIVLADRDIASTGNASLGALTLPDSSRITLGQNTRVQLGLFEQSASTNAKFTIYNGKTRFSIQHPNGAKANYTFSTPTAQIAVRGTIGDISVDLNDGMRLNVYHLGQPDLPVTVETLYGEHFTLHGGQKLWVRWQGGRLVGRQTRLSKAEVNRFAEFGPPSAIDGGVP
ncbi:MAG: hypothetical protein NVSMB31_03480 [Vulcanimicrobiaceae bacterium]